MVLHFLLIFTLNLVKLKFEINKFENSLLALIMVNVLKLGKKVVNNIT